MPKENQGPKDLPASTHADELTASWNKAKAGAERANRNLLQYGGALAAMLGISGGSSGVWAIVKAMPNSDFLEPFVPCFVAAFCGAGLFVGVLFLGLLNSFRARGKFEKQADEYFAQIVKLYPERFLPKSNSD